MLRLILDNDEDTESPLEDYGGSWKLYSFNRRHVNSLTAEQFDREFRDDEGDLTIELQTKLENGLAFWCDYFEHGQCRWSVNGTGPQCQWDNSEYAGLLVWEHAEADMGAKTYEDRQQDANNCLEVYSDWCNGACYWYRIERPAYCEHCGNEDNTEELTSCGGFIGSDYMFEEIRGFLDQYPDEEVEVTGTAKCLADYEDIRTPEKAT